MDLNEIELGSTIRIGNGKAEWTVVRITAPEQATALRPAGIGVARSTGHGRAIGIARLGEVTLVEAPK